MRFNSPYHYSIEAMYERQEELRDMIVDLMYQLEAAESELEDLEYDIAIIQEGGI